MFGESLWIPFNHAPWALQGCSWRCCCKSQEFDSRGHLGVLPLCVAEGKRLDRKYSVMERFGQVNPDLLHSATKGAAAGASGESTSRPRTRRLVAVASNRLVNSSPYDYNPPALVKLSGEVCMTRTQPLKTSRSTQS
eukprot:3085552-Amphidinium_carterae.1